MENVHTESQSEGFFLFIYFLLVHILFIFNSKYIFIEDLDLKSNILLSMPTK